LTKIEATITQSLISYFNEVLEEGNVYVIAHFTVVPNFGLTRLTKHRFRIIFHSKTIVVPTMSIGMPNVAFKFTSIDEIVEKTCDENFLIDFIGFITGVRQETDMGSHGERMKVIILEVVSGGFNVSCYEFSRFIPIVSDYLIASVGDDFVDWRAVRSIDQLKKNCE
ncbi:hypothetical protein S83_055293, partial [Arachis hypogaea]